MKKLIAAPKQNLNAAAAMAASAMGLEVRYRDDFPGPSQSSRIWHLGKQGAPVSHELRLTCTNGACFLSGWAGVVELVDIASQQTRSLFERLLVDPAKVTNGREAKKQLNRKFCEWAKAWTPTPLKVA